MAEAPVFVTGLARSGKTPLRIALGAHPHLSMTRKTRMWTELHGRFGNLADAVAFERCLDAIIADPRVARLEPDRHAIRAEFAERDSTYAELFGVLHAQHARRLGKRRWGEQAGELESFIGEIFETWPAAKVVHLVRLPAEWIPSRSSLRPGGLGAALALWRESARRALANRALHSDGYLILRLEEMREDPEGVLGSVADFLEIGVRPGMVDLLEEALASTTRSRLGRNARTYVEARTRELVAALGYTDTALTEPSAEVAGLASRLWFGSRRQATL